MTFTLAQLARNTSWTIFRPERNISGLKRLPLLEPDEIAIKIGRKKAKKGSLLPHPDQKMYVNLRFGKEIFRKMGWKAKDNICIFHHPDDALSFMLVKAATGKPMGYAIYMEAGNHEIMRMQFKWNNITPIEEIESQKVDYLYVESNNSIVFRVDGGK